MFGDGVSGHDGVGSVVAAVQAAMQLMHDVFDTGKHLVHRQAVADQPGRADRDLHCAGLCSPVRQRGRDGLCRGVRVLEAAGASTGVCTTGIEDHRT